MTGADYLPRYRLDEVEAALESAMYLRALSKEDKLAINGLFLRALNEIEPVLIWGPPDLRASPDCLSNAPYAS